MTTSQDPPDPGPEPLHVRGVLLPEGEVRDLWTRGGRLTFEPVPGARTIEGGWIVPGLVDAHCHVGLGHDGAVGLDEQEEQARADRDAGVLLLRDAGSPADTRWIDDRADLPRVVRAGRHIARSKRYIRNYGHEIEPGDLVTFVDQEARRGDGWVKLVADWIDRDKGDLAPCWPAEALPAAVARAHQLGARVTAHVFGESAIADLLSAGIDCLEHGTGVSGDLVDQVRDAGVAVVPTLTNTENFLLFADQGEARFPAYAATMRALHARRFETVRALHESGVPLFVGTDAGGAIPHGLAAGEIVLLARAGLSSSEALGAGSWHARSWLLGGDGHLCEGGPADFVVLPRDPLADLSAVLEPARVVLRGRVVG